MIIAMTITALMAIASFTSIRSPEVAAISSYDDIIAAVAIICMFNERSRPATTQSYFCRLAEAA